MHNLIRLASMAVIIGGGLLTLAPDIAHAAYPSCESVEGQPCTRGYMLCTHDYDGTQDTLVCHSGTWHYA